MSTITLLFPNAHRETIKAEIFGPKAPENITMEQVMHYVYQCTAHNVDLNEDRTISDKNETEVWGGEDAPQSWEQVRLIHMGAKVGPRTTLAELRLDISDIIHVSCKPAETETKSKKKALEEKAAGCCIIC